MQGLLFYPAGIEFCTTFTFGNSCKLVDLGFDETCTSSFVMFFSPGISLSKY
jgi:hypothetical protein